MSRLDPISDKAHHLRQHGAFYRGFQDVSDPLFQDSDFFDPRDIVQVKYEMLRRVLVDGRPVTEAVRRFGFSRQSFYHALSALKPLGLSGLVPVKRGPRGPHKFTPEVESVVRQAVEEDPSRGPTELAGIVEERLAVSLHPRTISRGLSRQKKKCR
ncbi:MAG TPA: helix-turn-helix domain-containing protein [Dehalococcoidia bacterium]|nr:helix-turn-helix domain-containing protein [Dehalococcoidia bacterium]